MPWILGVRDEGMERAFGGAGGFGGDMERDHQARTGDQSAGGF